MSNIPKDDVNTPHEFRAMQGVPVRCAQCGEVRGHALHSLSSKTDVPTAAEMIEQARRWPRDGFGEGRWFNAMADEIERLNRELWVIATCIWENAGNSAKHWAQGIRVSVTGMPCEPGSVKIVVPADETNSAHLTLFDAIKHGDEKHRAWLKQAIEDHFAGHPVLRPDEVTPMETKDRLSESEANEIATHVVQNVCELPGYTSPDDQPDLVMGTVTELHHATMQAIESFNIRHAEETGGDVHVQSSGNPGAKGTPVASPPSAAPRLSAESSTSAPEDSVGSATGGGVQCVWRTGCVDPSECNPVGCCQQLLTPEEERGIEEMRAQKASEHLETYGNDIVSQWPKGNK